MARRSNPRRVEILGVPFAIAYKANLVDGSERLHGLTHVDENRIDIDEQAVADGRLEPVLLHECIHAALNVSGVACLLDEKTEEAIVTALERALAPLYARRFK